MGENIVKVRDDNEPIEFEKSSEDNTFRTANGSTFEWCPDGSLWKC